MIEYETFSCFIVKSIRINLGEFVNTRSFLYQPFCTSTWCLSIMNRNYCIWSLEWSFISPVLPEFLICNSLTFSIQCCLFKILSCCVFSHQSLSKSSEMGRIVNIQFYKVTKLWSAVTVFPVLFVLINCEAVSSFVCFRQALCLFSLNL